MNGAVGRMMLMVAAFGCRTEPEPEPRPPDVLLVVMDTVRADALSAYGNARPTSPQFDVLASQGVRFAAAAVAAVAICHLLSSVITLTAL